MKAVILAAGIGSRLGSPYPKSFSVLPSGERIIGRQIRIFRELDIREIHVVVGFKKTLIMEEFSDVLFRYNPNYYITNTSKSLLCALRDLDDDIIWVNGDVAYDSEVVEALLRVGGNAVAVNCTRCGDEEVKYRTDAHGYLLEISKQVADPEGEALGVNFVSRAAIPALVQALTACADNDYFEKGIEMSIKETPYRSVDVSTYRCIEIDFEADLAEARRLFPE